VVIQSTNLSGRLALAAAIQNSSKTLLCGTAVRNAVDLSKHSKTVRSAGLYCLASDQPLRFDNPPRQKVGGSGKFLPSQNGNNNS
tara:strand:- start:542 stop:796 length:255 start_codon:yes stop_codon:yes gene_type:complete